MFSEIESMMMEDKPRFLTEEEKKIRKKCKQKISDKKYYQEHKEEKKIYREGHKEEIKEYFKTPQGYKATKKFNWRTPQRTSPLSPCVFWCHAQSPPAAPSRWRTR